MISVDPVLYRKVKNLLQIMGPHYKEPIERSVQNFHVQLPFRVTMKNLYNEQTSTTDAATVEKAKLMILTNRL